MRGGSTIANYQPAFREKVMPFLTEFQPDLLIVSAGYDANHADPWAELLYSLRTMAFSPITA